jgi:iron complex outermembrane recepter protein
MNRVYVFFCLLIHFSLVAQAQSVITGVVLDKEGKGLENASVRVLNSTSGTITDTSGRFTISNVSKVTLEVSKVGYASAIVASTEKEITITLLESYTQLEAVVVTAQKQEEDVQQIPASISALSAKQIENYRIWNTRDISAIVPNLYSANPGDNRNVTSLRGITSTSYDPAVATYVDGVSQFSLDTYIAQLFDVERIEVLRGSQGTLYGRNAMGGVINIITKQPTNKTTGFAELNIGNFGQQRYSVGIRTPIFKDKLFFGASVIYDKMNGFFINDTTNNRFDKKNSFTGNYFVKLIASKALSFTLNLKHNNNRNNGAFPLAGSIENALERPFRVNQNAATKLVDKVFNGSLTATYNTSRFTFTSQSAYQSNYRYYNTPIDGDFSPLDIITVVNNYGKEWNNVKVFTQEFKFTSPANNSSSFKWTAGAYGFYQSSPNKQGTHYGKSAGLFGVPNEFLLSTNIATTKGKNYGVAFFAQTTYPLNDKLELTSGLRYDYERKQLSVLGEFQPDSSPTAFITRSDTTAATSYNAISPKTTLAYHLTKEQQFFFSYALGFRTGGLTQLSSSPSQPPLFSYEPEYSTTLEVASKNTFYDNRLKLNLAAFHTQVTAAQIPTLVLPEAITITRNAGNLVSNGIELETSATPIDGLQFDFNTGFVNAHYKTLTLSSNGEAKNFNGNKALFTPNFTMLFATQYQLKIANKLKATIRGEWTNNGDQHFDLANKLRQPGYNIVNLRTGIVYDTFEIMFWMRNVTNKNYVIYAYDFGAAYLGNPRNFGVTLRKSF